MRAGRRKWSAGASAEDEAGENQGCNKWDAPGEIERFDGILWGACLAEETAVGNSNRMLTGRIKERNVPEG